MVEEDLSQSPSNANKFVHNRNDRYYSRT